MSWAICAFKNEVFLNNTHVNKAKEHTQVCTWNKNESIYVYDHMLRLKFLANDFWD